MYFLRVYSEQFYILFEMRLVLKLDVFLLQKLMMIDDKKHILSIFIYSYIYIFINLYMDTCK